jgi:hypothetical protein
VRQRHLLHSRRRHSHSRLGAAAPSIALVPPSIARRRLQHTYFLVSVRCFSEEKVWFAVSVHSRRRVLRSRRCCRQKYAKVIQLNRVSIIFKQIAAVNFLHFYFVKCFVKMDRKVTSNIKFKKYKFLNKRSTNNLCTFLTFQAVIKKLISIRIFDASICFE